MFSNHVLIPLNKLCVQPPRRKPGMRTKQGLVASHSLLSEQKKETSKFPTVALMMEQIIQAKGKSPHFPGACLVGEARLGMGGKRSEAFLTNHRRKKKIPRQQVHSHSQPNYILSP